MDDLTGETRWTHRAIPTKGAVKTATFKADDGHTIRADVFGMGATLGEPRQLIVTAEPLPTLNPKAPPVERWPTILELMEAADELAPGDVLALQFFGNPRGVPRVAVPPGTPRSFTALQIGELTAPGEIVWN